MQKHLFLFKVTSYRTFLTFDLFSNPISLIQFEYEDHHSRSTFQQNPIFLFTVKIPPFFSIRIIKINPKKGVKSMVNIKLDLSRFKKKPIYSLIHPNWPLFWETDSNWCHFNLLIESNQSKLTRRNSSWLHHRPGLITVVKTQWKWLLSYATLLSFMNCSSQTSKFNSSWWITWADVQRITQPNFKSTSLHQLYKQPLLQNSFYSMPSFGIHHPLKK